MRSRSSAILVAFGLIFMASGCGSDSPDEVFEQQLTVMDEMCGILDEVKDNSSAEAAIPKLEASAQRLLELDAKIKESLSEEEQKELREKYGAKIKDAAKRLSEASFKAGSKAPQKAIALAMAMMPKKPKK